MSPRLTTMCLAIGMAAAFTLSSPSSGAAQVTTDTAGAAQRDTATQRIRVQKETGTTGGFDTTTSTGTLANPSRDTTTGVTTDTTTTPTVTGQDTTMMQTDTLRADTIPQTDTTLTDTSRVFGDTSTTRADTSVRSDTTIRTDTSITQTDTTTIPQTDTSLMQQDTSLMQQDTSLMQQDTSQMQQDTSLMQQDTSLMQQDTSLMQQDTSTVRDTSLFGRDTTAQQDTAGVFRTDTAGGEVVGDTVGLYPERPSRGFLGRGFYIGVGGGASIPVGNFNDGYKTGWNVTVPIGWQSSSTPWGARLDLSYDRAMGRSLSAGGVNVSLSDAAVWSATLDLTADFPLGGSRTSVYLVGGGGVHHFPDYGEASSTIDIGGVQYTTSAESVTEFGLNGGGGLAFRLGPMASLFVESRFVSVFTEGENTNFVPVIAGFRFF